MSLNCLAFGCGCGPGYPTYHPHVSPEPRVIRVSLGELVRAYRTSPNEHCYTGRTIQVFVPADDSRRFERGYVDAFKVLTSRPGCVRFKTQVELLDPKADLMITGTCRGIVPDGVHRSPGVDWYVSVEDCQVTQLFSE